MWLAELDTILQVCPYYRLVLGHHTIGHFILNTLFDDTRNRNCLLHHCSTGSTVSLSSQPAPQSLLIDHRKLQTHSPIYAIQQLQILWLFYKYFSSIVNILRLIYKTQGGLVITDAKSMVSDNHGLDLQGHRACPQQRQGEQDFCSL